MKKRARRPAKKMTIERAVSILLQEISDVRSELKQDIHGLSLRMNNVETGLKNVRSDIGGLRVQVHGNHLTLMRYMDRTDRRLDAVEAKIG